PAPPHPRATQRFLGSPRLYLRGGTPRLVASPPHPRPPVLVQQLPLPLHVLGGRQVQLQRRRLQGRQHLLGDEGVQPPARQALALRLAVAGQRPVAVVAEAVVGVVVVDHHPVAAPAAHQEPAHQTRTLLPPP